MITADQRQAVLDRFEQRIRQLDEEGRILAYPSTSPKELAHRSIKVQPPFLSKDRGMRDTIIWLTAKERVVKGIDCGTKVTLVSNDGGFWDKDKIKLKEGLTAELMEAGISHDSIVVRRTLQEAIATLVSGRLSPADWITVAIQGGQIADLTASSDTVLLKATDWILNDPDILNFHGAYLFVEFDVVEGVFLQRIEQALNLDSSRVLVESSWTCDVAAEGFNNPYFGDNLSLTLGFELSSIIKVDDDCLSVQSHEVTSMEVINFIETEPEEYSDGLEY